VLRLYDISVKYDIKKHDLLVVFFPYKKPDTHDITEIPYKVMKFIGDLQQVIGLFSHNKPNTHDITGISCKVVKELK
jgi:hypothetical protein